MDRKEAMWWIAGGFCFMVGITVFKAFALGIGTLVTWLML